MVEAFPAPEVTEAVVIHQYKDKGHKRWRRTPVTISVVVLAIALSVALGVGLSGKNPQGSSLDDEKSNPPTSGKATPRTLQLTHAMHGESDLMVCNFKRWCISGHVLRRAIALTILLTPLFIDRMLTHWRKRFFITQLWLRDFVIWDTHQFTWEGVTMFEMGPFLDPPQK
jgi:hypothetical protein